MVIQAFVAKDLILTMAGSLHRYLTITAALVSILLLAFSAHPQDNTKKELDQKAKQRMLKREAANALFRLKLRLEKEGFYSGRVALNVWRSTAIDAGTFDQEKYNEFKKQLYEKSVNDSLKCFEEFILEENYYDANVCLQTWRMHSKELGNYDKEKYEALKERLQQARIEKAAREAEEKKAEKTGP